VSESIYGKPFLIRLPFKCDERVEKWGLHGYSNIDCYDQFEGDQQYFLFLYVIARKQRSKRKVEGSFSIVDDDGGDGGRIGGDS
jgi:hypothetical protein